MDSHFFNFYGYETQNSWTGRKKQLVEAGYNDSDVVNTFGAGLASGNTYPTHLDNEGTFMSATEQLADINPELDISNYVLAYGTGYVEKEPGSKTPDENGGK